MKRINADTVLGSVVLVMSIVSILVWVPMDTGSAMIEKVRGSQKIGDALAPTVAFLLLGLAGIILVFEARVTKSVGGLKRKDITFVLLISGIYLVAVLIMRWTGPLITSLLSEESYRNLRDTLPWKYLGYVGGGSFLIGSMISLAQQRFSIRAFLIGMVSSVLLAALYDLPFDDLLLPPNGDV